MIKSNKENTLKTRETDFLYRKPQNLKIAKNSTNFSKNLSNFFFSMSRILPKNEKWIAIAENLNLVFPSNWVESNLSFRRTFLRFSSALGILQPQIYVVVEQFGAENLSLLSGRLVFKGCLNGGPGRRSETDARYSQQLQTGLRPESIF